MNAKLKELYDKCRRTDDIIVDVLKLLYLNDTFKTGTIRGYCQGDWQEYIVKGNVDIDLLEAFYFGKIADITVDSADDSFGDVITHDELWKAEREDLKEYFRKRYELPEDEEIHILKAGGMRQVSATILPDNTTYKNVEWKSDDESIVSIDANGMPATISARTYLKQADFNAYTNLAYYAEPLNAMAGNDSTEYLKRGWKYLISNHTHDANGGCAPDCVCKDIEYRFRKASDIGEIVADDAMVEIAKNLSPIGNN